MTDDCALHLLRLSSTGAEVNTGINTFVAVTLVLEMKMNYTVWQLIIRCFAAHLS